VNLPTLWSLLIDRKFLVSDGNPRIPEMDALAQRIQAQKGSESEKMLQFLSEGKVIRSIDQAQQQD